MTQDIFGKLSGVKGYISKALSDLLWSNGIQIITKLRKNMKKFNISQADKIMLHKIAIIKCVDDELKNICKLQQTRHRSVNNFSDKYQKYPLYLSFLPEKALPEHRS